MTFFLILLIIWAGASLLFRESYLGELSMSFLPYWWTAMSIGLLISLWGLWKYLHWKKEEKTRFWIQFSTLFVVGFGSILGVFLWKFHNFYNHYQLSGDSQANLKVLFSNIYKDNLGYDELTGTLARENPDVAMFVEFEEHHYEHLKGFLEKQFAFVEYLPWSTSIVVSKYPLSLLPTSVKGQKWRYHYFQIQKGDQHYLAYLVHTSSPTSQRHFNNRNHQLKIISNDFLTMHQASRWENGKVFMVWDFNISPWSKYYEEFSNELSGTMDNATRSFPYYFSWNLSKLLKISGTLEGVPELLYSHIDQLLVSKNLKIKSLTPLQFSWSDHKGFLFEIE